MPDTEYETNGRYDYNNDALTSRADSSVPNSNLPYYTKEFYCNSCNIRVTSQGIPDNWYILKRSRGPHVNLLTVAIVCSLKCLLQDTVREILFRTGLSI